MPAASKADGVALVCFQELYKPGLCQRRQKLTLLRWFDFSKICFCWHCQLRQKPTFSRQLFTRIFLSKARHCQRRFKKLTASRCISVSPLVIEAQDLFKFDTLRYLLAAI
jgi:hypothetical protein